MACDRLPLCADEPFARRRPDGGDRRIREGDPRNGAVVGRGITAREVRRRHSCLVLPDVREHRDPGHVADRPDVLARAQAAVDLDPTPRDLDVEVIEPETLDVRPSPRRNQ